MIYTDVEKVLEEKIIRGMRRVFEFDDEFRYNKTNENSKVIITPDYPDDNETPFQIPHIIVSNISFSADPQMALSNNLVGDVGNAGIVNYGQEYFSVIRYSTSLVCLGEYDISRNLANRVFFYVQYQAYEYLSDSLGLNILSVAKSPSTPREQYPEKVFQTAVEFQGTMQYRVYKNPFNYMDGNISKPIGKLGQSITKVDVKTILKGMNKN